MGFLDDLFRGKERPASPLHQWGMRGRGATDRFMRESMQFDQKERRRQRKLMTQDYKGQRSMLQKGFDDQVNITKTMAQRDAAARGLGKSTIGSAIAPTMQLNMQRQQALGQLRSNYIQGRRSIGPTPTHFYRFMRKKNQLGALEPYQQYLSQGGRSGGLLGTIGTAAGAYFGGPMGAQIGGQIGNAI